MTTKAEITWPSIFPTITTSNTTNDVCKEQANRNYQIFWIAIIAIIITCNLLLLLAIAKCWSILRQNIVHRYLISCLLSVVAFCLLSTYEILHTIDHVDADFLGETVLQKFNSSNSMHYAVMQRYAFRKGLLPILAIVMQFNITVLIYAVSDNAVFVGRYSNLDPLTKPQIKCPVLQKNKHVLMCVLAWLGPFGFSIPVAFGWNCVDRCLCLPAYRWFSTCTSGKTINECSRTWLPMSRSFVLVITCFYFAATAMNFGLLHTTVKKFRRTHARPSSERPSADLSVIEQQSSTPKISAQSRTRNQESSQVDEDKHAGAAEAPSQKYTQDERIENVATMRAKSDHQKKRSRSSIAFMKLSFRRPLGRTIVLLIVITSLMFIFVTPMIGIWLLDVIITKDVSSGIGFPIALSLSYIYCAALPFILVKYMSRLRKACISFFVACPFLHTTTAKKSSATSAS